MNFPQKRKVNVAAASKRRHDLSHIHLTTTSWGRMKPIELRYMVPGDEFNFNVACQTRVLDSLPSPTIGKFDMKYRAFFVPIHNIWNPFYDFLKNQPTIIAGEQAVVTNTPYTTLNEILLCFTESDTYGLAERVIGPESESEYDFELVDTQTPPYNFYYKFTRQGRIIYDFLTSCGLNIAFTNDTTARQTKINILPFVAFWKAYFDWVVPSRFIKDHEDYIEHFISDINNDNSSVAVGREYLMKYLFKEPLAYFLDDIFTTSTKFPFQSSDDLNNNFVIPQPSTIDSAVYADSPDDFGSDGSGAYAATTGSFNMYTLQTLGKLQDMLNRQLIAGSKVQDWLLTEFGIRPNNDALHLSTYLGSKTSTLEVSTVISNADTLSADGKTGVALGSYGGYLNEKSGFDFSYKAQEHGYFIVTFELVPRTSYYQGLNIEFDMQKPLDFFQPEFDNQQSEPLPFKSLFFDQKRGTEATGFTDKFGFQLQYSRFKFAPDYISGDFRNRFGLALKSWYLARDMRYLGNDTWHELGIDEQFCLVKSIYQDWNYIFSDTSGSLDPFACYFDISMPCLRPMKSITEGFEPTYQNGGKDVTLDFSGAVK